MAHHRLASVALRPVHKEPKIWIDLFLPLLSLTLRALHSTAYHILESYEQRLLYALSDEYHELLFAL
jgi:hypothetical protein